MRLSRTIGPTNLPEMASPAPPGRLKNAIKYHRKVRKTGLKCRKRLITRKWCQIRQKISVLQRQRRLQIYRVKNIGRFFELSGVAFRLGGLLVELFSRLQKRFRLSFRPSDPNTMTNTAQEAIASSNSKPVMTSFFVTQCIVCLFCVLSKIRH